MFKCDYHTHTFFSFDGDPTASPEALCDAAIANGVTDLAITDHFECNQKYDAAYPAYDAEAAYRAIAAVKEKYAGKLNVAIGIEIGQANQYPDEASSIFDRFDYDFVIGSLHNLRGAPDFYFYDFSKIDVPYISSLFERNIQELCAIVDSCERLDTLGHITYMHRYVALIGNTYVFSDHKDSLAHLFSKMISRDIALEINVSTISKGLGFSMPDKDILRLYRECGGKLVTIGTDSHTPLCVGKYVEYGFDIAKESGLNDVLVVRDGKKAYIKI